MLSKTTSFFLTAGLKELVGNIMEEDGDSVAPSLFELSLKVTLELFPLWVDSISYQCNVLVSWSYQLVACFCRSTHSKKSSALEDAKRFFPEKFFDSFDFPLLHGGSELGATESQSRRGVYCKKTDLHFFHRKHSDVYFCRIYL